MSVDDEAENDADQYHECPLFFKRFAASGSQFLSKKAGDNGNSDKGQHVAERLFDNLLLMLVKSGKQVKNTDGGCCAGNAPERQVADKFKLNGALLPMRNNTEQFGDGII